MGVGALKLADMREYMRVVRELLAGNIVEYEFEGAQRKITFMHPVPGWSTHTTRSSGICRPWDHAHGNLPPS